MSVNRILLFAAVAVFAIVALSSFSDEINVNEPGWLAVGLTAYAASQLNFSFGAAGPRRRRQPR